MSAQLRHRITKFEYDGGCSTITPLKIHLDASIRSGVAELVGSKLHFIKNGLKQEDIIPKQFNVKERNCRLSINQIFALLTPKYSYPDHLDTTIRSGGAKLVGSKLHFIENGLKQEDIFPKQFNVKERNYRLLINQIFALLTPK